jgi:hypothetical protein
MGHGFDGSLGVTRNRVETQVHPWRDDKAIVGKLPAVIEIHGAPFHVDGSCAAMKYIDTVSAQASVAELLNFQLAQSRDHGIAQRACDVSVIGFEQCDIDAAIFALDQASATRARKAAADNHDLRLCFASCPSRRAESGKHTCSGHAAEDLPAATLLWHLRTTAQWRELLHRKSPWQCDPSPSTAACRHETPALPFQSVPL